MLMVLCGERIQHKASEPDRSIGSGQSHNWHKVLEFSTDLWKNLWKTHQIVEKKFSTGIQCLKRIQPVEKKFSTGNSPTVT